MNILYECVKEGNPHPVVSALVVKDDKVLMALRGKGSYEGYWCLPGGMIDKNEEPDAAVLRELLEETGVVGISPKLLTAYLIRCDDGLVHTSIDLVYHVKAQNDFKTSDSDEITHVAYFTKIQLPEKIAFGHRRIINQFAHQL